MDVLSLLLLYVANTASKFPFMSLPTLPGLPGLFNQHLLSFPSPCPRAGTHQQPERKKASYAFFGALQQP